MLLAQGVTSQDAKSSRDTGSLLARFHDFVEPEAHFQEHCFVHSNFNIRFHNELLPQAVLWDSLAGRL